MWEVPVTVGEIFAFTVFACLVFYVSQEMSTTTYIVCSIVLGYYLESRRLAFRSTKLSLTTTCISYTGGY